MAKFLRLKAKEWKSARTENIGLFVITLVLKVHVKRSINVLMWNGDHIGHIGPTPRGW